MEACHKRQIRVAPERCRDQPDLQRTAGICAGKRAETGRHVQHQRKQRTLFRFRADARRTADRAGSSGVYVLPVLSEKRGMTNVSVALKCSKALDFAYRNCLADYSPVRYNKNSS